MTMHAWYSPKQHALLRNQRLNAKTRATYRLNRYRLVDGAGEVTATEVSRTMESKGTWDDYEYLGEVDQWLGHVEP